MARTTCVATPCFYETKTIAAEDSLRRIIEEYVCRMYNVMYSHVVGTVQQRSVNEVPN